MLSRTERKRAGAPPTRTSPVMGRRPTMPSKSSVRPAPTKPARPRISPRRTASDASLANPATDTPRASRTAGPPGMGLRSGNSRAISRPTIRCAIPTVSTSPARRRATTRPSRSTVMRSAISATSGRRCEM